MPTIDLEGDKNALIQVITDAYVHGEMDVTLFEGAVSRITATKDESTLAVEAASLGLSFPAFVTAGSPSLGEPIDLDCGSASIRKMGDWLRSSRYRLKLRSSSVRLDLRDYADARNFHLDLEIVAVSSSIKLIVPRGFEVEDRIEDQQSSVVRNRPRGAASGTQLIRIRGSLRSSTLGISYR